jgi:hypothetical protein
MRVALVACSGTKLAEPAPARDLYRGDLFRKSRAWAEANADRWYILSALHYVLHPDKEIEPYEQKMATQVDVVRGWASVVDGRLRTSNALFTGTSFHGQYQSPKEIGLGAWVMAGGNVHITMLAGAAYCDPLVPTLETWATVDRPLAGMGIGEQKAALMQGELFAVKS